MGVGCNKLQAALWLNATRYNNEPSALLDVCLACNGAILQFTERAPWHQYLTLSLSS